MLQREIDRVNDVLAHANLAQAQRVLLPARSVGKLLIAARLLLQIHEASDKGELDEVDLEWLAQVDRLVVGDEDDC